MTAPDDHPALAPLVALAEKWERVGEFMSAEDMTRLGHARLRNAYDEGLEVAARIARGGDR